MSDETETPKSIVQFPKAFNTKTPEEVKSLYGLIAYVFQLYGRDLFVAVLLLGFWYVVVYPEQESQRTEFETNRQTATTLLETSHALERIADNLKTTALMWDRISMRTGVDLNGGN
jgi:hypothetical protein